MTEHDKYKDPLVSRYTSEDMQKLFSDDFKFQTWRACWIALAKAEMELGIDVIKPEMIDELVAAQKIIDYDFAKKKEGELRHDVLAHIAEYGTHCPTAEGIIHLGATSMFVVDNTDLIQMQTGMEIIKTGLINVINNMSKIAEKHEDLVTLAFTHYQPAQPTTIGKRFTLYMNDLLDDLNVLENIEFKARGAKGATGTQASYMKLFDNDFEKVKKLDMLVAKKLGFDNVFPVTGQTYSRKFDISVITALAGIGESLSKFSIDMRLMSNMKIVDEPFQAYQKGSSAMPYKRNPMRSERLTGLARLLIGMVSYAYDTAKNQMLERTLDDSSPRRIYIPQSFLLADACLILANNITNQDVNPEKGRPMTFYGNRITKLLNEELPFMATEVILMDLVKLGYNRQEMHEVINKHAVEAGLAIKENGADNTLFERLGNDMKFPWNEERLNSYLAKPEVYAGAASQQTTGFLTNHVAPVLKKYEGLIGKSENKINV